jgi:hypothetical protein
MLACLHDTHAFSLGTYALRGIDYTRPLFFSWTFFDFLGHLSILYGSYLEISVVIAKNDLHCNGLRCDAMLTTMLASMSRPHTWENA